MNPSEPTVAEQLSASLFMDDWPENSLEAPGHPGQWRLARVDVANWGTFCGFHHMKVDRKGLLITGASGSGKSSLLDAVTMVLTPPKNRHLNAAARSGSSTGEDRTPASYIRGAWRHVTDDAGEVTCSYLRANTATWSGIMLRYENGENAQPNAEGEREHLAQPINLLALFNMKAGSNTVDGISQVYAIIRGDCTLEDYERYAVNGIDAKRLKTDGAPFVQTFKEHNAFAASFCRKLGIAGPKTLELLHKTQAAKNFGSLDDLFRNFMLERPHTFEQADTAVEQFTALSQAHAGVVDQRRQMKHLEPLEELNDQHAAARRTVEHMEALEEGLAGFTEKLALRILRAEHERLKQEVDRCTQALISARTEQTLAGQAFEQAQSALTDAGGGVLDQAENQLLEYQRQTEQVEKNRQSMLADLKCADIDELPETYPAWQKLARAVDEMASEARAEQDRQKTDDYRAYGRVPDLESSIAATEKELRYLRQRETNIPGKLHAVREDIARDLGIPLQDLPFVGELVSVKPEYAAWRGSIERLMENRAKTLLVSTRNIQAVSHYVEHHNLGTRLEFISVPPDVEVPKRTLGPLSLLHRLTVKQHRTHPEFSHWTSRHLRERFDFACVDSPEELASHRFAITISGQIKRENHYVKDDRHRLDDKTRWVLGDNNDEKIQQYEQQLVQLQADLKTARSAARKISERTRRAQDLERAATILSESAWSSFDLLDAQTAESKAREFYETIKRGSVHIEQATAVRDQAKLRRTKADEAATKAQLDLGDCERQAARTDREIADHEQRLKKNKQPSAEDENELLLFFKKADRDFEKSVGNVYPASNLVSTTIQRRASEAQTMQQKTRDRAERIMHEYGREWPLQAADLTESFDDIDAHLEIYRQIKASGLPDYEQRFLHVLHDFSQDQITVIASTIRDAFREVKEKLIPVNRSLSLSPYSPTTTLQIKAKSNRGAQVDDFLATLKEIAQGTWDENDIASAEARFEKTNAIISRLKSSEYADRTWRAACLDTRRHVSFIANELDKEGNVVNVHSSDTGLSGGQKQKLVIFCLAAALRYQLADEDQPVPRYGTVVLDEAFDKADPAFARTAMDIFDVFGFHMVLATPYKLISVLAPYIGAIVATHCQDSKYSSLTLVDFEADEVDDEESADDEAQTPGTNAAATQDDGSRTAEHDD